MVDLSNFFISTQAVFKGCKIPKRKPDYVSDSGSIYWYGENKKGSYVIRQSDHWVNLKKIGNNTIIRQCARIATCQWHLKTNHPGMGEETIAGKCYLGDFQKI
jgi:hypothetical protein